MGAGEPFPLQWLKLSLSCREDEDEDLTAEERFRRAREAMRVWDAADRAAQKAARREKKIAKKERSRASATAEAGGAAVQLGAPSAVGAMSEGEEDSGVWLLMAA